MFINFWRLVAATALAASVLIAPAIFATAGHADQDAGAFSRGYAISVQGHQGRFQRTYRHKLVIHYGTIGAVNEWILGGEEADFVIGSSQSMPALVTQGKINAHQFAISKTGIGVVTAPSTEISVASVEEFKQALLAAKAIVYADPIRGGAAGIHVAKVIEKLGLTDRVKPKLRLGAGGDITEITLSLGPGALGITQISEIAGKRDAQFVGPLPEELQNYTVFIGGIPANAQRSEAVSVLIKFLRTPTGIAVIRAKGMEDLVRMAARSESISKNSA